jgi:hypothetical protein
VPASVVQIPSHDIVQQKASALQSAFTHGLQSAMSASPMSQTPCVQSHAAAQVASAASTHAAVHPEVQHAGVAAHTAVTHGSAPQSWPARAWQLVSHEALPQHVGFCAQTASTQGSWHLVGLSAAPVVQTVCGHAGVPAQGPQSAGQPLQSSPVLQVPSPQQSPQVVPASDTHCPSHVLVQQNGSIAHTMAAQGSQAPSMGPPVSQAG